MGQHYRMGSAIALVALVAGCGGGGDGTSASAAKADAADARMQALSTPVQNRAAPLAARPATNEGADDEPFVPDDMPVGTGRECTDAEHVRLPDPTDPLPGLASRHVFCVVYKARASRFSVQLVQKRDGSFRYARAGENSTGEFALGEGEMETRLQIYGPPTSLKKTLRIQQRIVNFQPFADYPGPAASVVVTRPVVSCLPQAECTLPASMPKLSVATDGAWSEAKNIVMRYNWVDDDPDPTIDYRSYQVSIGLFSYAVGKSPIGVYFDGNWASFNIPSLRCDRGMSVSGGEACVFPDAAPVLKLSRLDGAVKESAQHILDAQQGKSPGMQQKAPGAFLLKPGTRAVADDSVKGMFFWLTRQKKTTPGFGDNREASCHGAGSLIKQRPRNASNSCPLVAGKPPTGCDCDEYPYNASYEGGAAMPQSTSVKYINGADNQESGRRMKSMQHWERVLDFSKPDDTGRGEPYWVQIVD